MANGRRGAAGDILDAAMPFLRRFGRALSGNQNTGDALAARARQATRGAITTISAKEIRILLFRNLHRVWTGLRASSLSQTAARQKIGSLTPNSREALLLRAVEEFSFVEIGQILELAERDVRHLFECALHEMPYQNGTRVLIIEDDTMIAMDMSACLGDMGCVVTGVGRTASEAIELAATSPPELIIASLTLADKSSGMLAAREICRQRPDTDVVFVTPYPEQLLTGTTQEPVFIIAKPYLDDQVRSAVSQSLILRGG